MEKCVDCGCETKDMVWEFNIGELVPLCKGCQNDNYRKCKVCGQYYPKDEVGEEIELCESCRDL